MSELSQHAKLIKAIEIAKVAQVGIELSYFDVLEVAGELNEAKEVVAMLNARIAELEEEQVILKDQMRDATNILIDKRLHIDSLYEEGYKLQQRIAELEEAQRWIPVSERLPELYRDGDGEFIPFLVCENDKDYPYRAIYDGLNWGDGMFVADVTHWMPLPEPPEVK